MRNDDRCSFCGSWISEEEKDDFPGFCSKECSEFTADEDEFPEEEDEDEILEED